MCYSVACFLLSSFSGFDCAQTLTRTVLCFFLSLSIHDGTSCATDGGEHYWDQETMGFMDVWTVPNGAYYQGAPSGRATGSYALYNGFGAEENRGRAVIVHGSDGSRIGCGILG